MPQQTPYSNLPSVRTREPNKIATTTITNELADAINQNRVVPHFGVVSDNSTVVATSSKGQYQGMGHFMLTNNQDGWTFPMFVPPLDE